MLTANQRDRLRKSGFSTYEIGVLNSDLEERPQKIDLSSGVWKDVIRRRRQWVSRMLKSGKTLSQAMAKANRRYIVDDEASVWDFVKAEYRPPGRIENYAVAQKRRAAERIKGTYDLKRITKFRRGK